VPKIPHSKKDIFALFCGKFSVTPLKLWWNLRISGQ